MERHAVVGFLMCKLDVFEESSISERGRDQHIIQHVNWLNKDLQIQSLKNIYAMNIEKLM